jgi:hypothetical protein
VSTLTPGPLGFPLTDKQARNLEAILHKLGHPEYRKTVFVKAPTELNPGERSDVSWISTETPDRYDHIVLAKGMDDSQFALNPIVTLNHDYSIPPIGRSLWRKLVKDGATRGIKAKTVYPSKPTDWPAAQPWQPDLIFMQIQAGLLNAKSIGWLPTKTHYADAREAERLGCKEGTLIIEEWLLIEYAVGTIPVNPETVVDVVSKLTKPAGEPREPAGSFPHITLEELEKALQNRIRSIDVSTLARQTLDRMRGRV